MQNIFEIVMFILCLLVAIAVFYEQSKSQQWKQKSMEQERLKQAKQDLLALDAALSDWFDLLQLPQLAEETKRQEAARQLRTVLIEKLMRQKVPD